MSFVSEEKFPLVQKSLAHIPNPTTEGSTPGPHQGMDLPGPFQ